MSSSALTAIDLPAPERPVTIRKFIFPTALLFYHANFAFQHKAGPGLNNLSDLLGQCDHVGAGRAAAVDDKAAVLFTDLCTAHGKAPQAAVLDQLARKRALGGA